MEARYKGRVIFFGVKKKTWTPFIGTYVALKIIKNRIGLRKLWPPKVGEVKNSKEQITECYKG
jgi:hypothetical protein